jgi:signal transduction histidine kinase/ActR/RegA family two-component response regulator
MHRSFIDRLLLPAIFGLSTIVVALVLWQMLITHQHGDIQAVVQEQASFVQTKMESELKARIQPLERLAARWQTRRRSNEMEMESDASLVISGYPAYREIEWVDPEFHVLWATTSEGNEATSTADLTRFPALRATLESASYNKGTAIAPRVDLGHDGRGFLVCVPVYAGEKLRGYLVGAFREREFLSSILNDVARDYWITVYDGKEAVYTRTLNEPPQEESYLQEVKIQFGQLEWRVLLWPMAGAAAYARSSLPTVVFVAGILMAVILAFAVYMAETAHLNVKKLETANRELEKEVAGREQAEEALRHAQKMEAIGRLAGGVAHDFNNMLMVIRGQAALSLNSVGPGTALRRELTEIVKAADRASSLTRKLLAFGRKQVLQPRVIDLNVLVTQIAVVLPSVLGEDIKLNMILEPELGRVKADAAQLEQVIMNLVFNARDAMPRGGDLTIQTSNCELDSAWSRSHLGAQPGPHVMLSVRDSGHGMDEETQSHLFEPFFTTKDTSKGTGLGMATVYGTVNQSGGCVTVSSKLGLGTTVQIYLPRIEEPVEFVEIPIPAVRSIEGEEKILVVEDDNAVRRMTREFLKLSGYTVVEARSAAEAIEWMESHDEPIDMVLTDVVMPGMKGRELVEQLASLRPGLKVLYMSAYTEDHAINVGILGPGAAFIEKPFSPDELAAKVREVLSGNSPSHGKRHVRHSTQA